MEDTATEAAGPPPSLFAENADILGWLDILLKGKPEQQALARTEIAMILEARGFADDAEEAYWANVQAKTGDRRAYERLISLYRERKDRLSESLVKRQLEDVFSPREVPQPASPDEPRPVDVPRAADATRTPSAPRTASTPSSVIPSLAAQLTAPEPPSRPAAPVRRLRSARQSSDEISLARRDNPRLRSLPAPEPADDYDDEPLAYRPFPAPARRRDDDPERRRLAPRPIERTAEIPIFPTPPHTQAIPRQALPAGGARTVRADEVVAPGSPGAARGRRARLSPNPGPGRSRHFSGSGLIALQPTTILAFVLASFGVAALIAFLLIFSGRGSAQSAGSSQVPARCADGATRFPGANDPRGAVVSAYRQIGVDVEMPRPGGARLTADQAEQVVGGWMAASLLLEHAGQPAPKLSEWLDSTQSDRPTLANAILAGRSLDRMLTPDEWTELQSWPASNCEGGFMRDSRNAGLVRLIERVVAR
jgi:hypothetical protein